MSQPDRTVHERILLVAPVGADAQNMREALAAAGMSACICANLSTAAHEFERGCGAILVTEESFEEDRSHALADALQRQPAWSDVPLIVIVSGARRAEESPTSLRHIRVRSNFTLVERPLRKETLRSTVASALRARRRQYEVRSLLVERDELLASLERRVAERTAKLQELNADLEAFSYSISHDLRAPLRSIENYSRVLTEEFMNALPPEAQNYMVRITKNTERMDRLLQDVLTFSRMARGEMRIEPVDLDRLLDEVLELHPTVAAGEPHITVHSPLGWVLGHAPSLTQCFSNLLQNALKFAAPERTPVVEVRAELLRDGLRRVHVKDNGIGIAPSNQKRIFDLFERAGPTHIPGTGLGLAIVKRAAERMGGGVGVESVPGEGSRFWIDLPAAPPLSPPSEQIGRASTSLRG